MRNVLIALVVGFVGQGVAVAGQCYYPCEIETTRDVTKVVACAPTYQWEYPVVLKPPVTAGYACYGGTCIAAEGPPTSVSRSVDYGEPPDYENCYAPRVTYEAQYTGSASYQDCDGDQVCECCSALVPLTGLQFKSLVWGDPCDCP